MSDKSAPSPLGGMTSEQDFDRQMRRLSMLEAAVNSSSSNELQSSRDAAQAAIAAYEGQEIVVAALRRRLDTAERVIKTTIEAQSDGTSSKLYTTSVEHALFNPQGELSAIKSQLKALQNRFDWEGAIENENENVN